jgi:hypothetical protein
MTKIEFEAIATVNSMKEERMLTLFTVYRQNFDTV